MKKLILVILIFGHVFQSYGIPIFINKNELYHDIKKNSDSSLFNLLNLINKNLYRLQVNKDIQGRIKNNSLEISKEVVSTKWIKDTYKLDQKNIFIHGEREGFSASELSGHYLQEFDSISILWNTESIRLQAVYGSSSAYGIIVLHPKKESYNKKRATVDKPLQTTQNDNLTKDLHISDMIKEIQAYLNDIDYIPKTENYIIMENKKIKLSDLTAKDSLLYNKLEIRFIKSKKASSSTRGLIYLTKGA